MPFKPFGKVFEKSLGKRGISLRSFATLAGLSAAAVSRIKSGFRAVPTARVEAWADILELTGHERAEFVNAAYWTAVPKRVRPWVESQITAARRGG